MTHCAFCPVCNYAVDKIAIAQARYDYECPNCYNPAKPGLTQTLSNFYSYGSYTHRELREIWDRLKRGPRFLLPGVFMPPLPFPIKDATV